MARVGPQTAAAEMIPRGRYIGKRVDDPPKDEAEHFIRCPACADHPNSSRIYRKFIGAPEH